MCQLQPVTVDARFCLPNVAALTRESPSEARVSSVFNAQLASPYCDMFSSSGVHERNRKVVLESSGRKPSSSYEFVDGA
jgi:hypothetical protein